MFESERGIDQAKFRSQNWTAEKVFLLLFINGVGVLFPLSYFPLGGWGKGTYDFYLLCAIVQSASLYYGADLFDQTRSPYVWSLITNFLTASAVGAILFAAGVKEVWFHDGTCIPFGAPTYLFFGLFQLRNLPFALIISPLWMTVRWLERTTQLFWFRQKHKNLFKR